MDSAGDVGAGDSPAVDDEGSTARTRAVEWVLVGGDRVRLEPGISAAVPVLLLALDAAGLIAFTKANSVTRMASGMIAGTFSLVTLVVSINQLILSREFSTAGEFRDRLSGVAEFRGDVADVTGAPASPAVPTRLLELLVDAIRRRADALADAVDDGDGEYWDRVEGYAEEVAGDAARVDGTLEGSGSRRSTPSRRPSSTTTLGSSTPPNASGTTPPRLRGRPRPRSTTSSRRCGCPPRSRNTSRRSTSSAS
ncbi:hypothetical protein [Halorarum salinum]|uniref:hypothetical protein n=1 Tax=Halorarum salinum TaxID=2743089 RepID=UPI001FE39B87|nr:hypothetical protein [Halobaculum salinum]